MASTLIYGNQDAVLTDPGMTAAPVHPDHERSPALRLHQIADRGLP
jgi:hypothetical protein